MQSWLSESVGGFGNHLTSKKTVEGEPQTLQFVKNFRFPRRLPYERGGCTTPGEFCQGVFVFRAEVVFHVELF